LLPLIRRAGTTRELRIQHVSHFPCPEFIFDMGKQSVRVLYLTLEDMSLHKGSVVHIREVIASLRKRGHSVGLIASSSNQPENTGQFYNLKILGDPILMLFGLKRQPYVVSSILLFLYLLKILPHYHIIYARDYHTALLAFFPRVFFKKRLVLEINGLANEEQKLKSLSIFNRFTSALIRKAEKGAIQFSDQIISVTPQIKSYLVNHFQCEAGKVEVVGNGVDTKRFHPIADKKLLVQWRERFGIGTDELVAIFVGNLARWQGVDILIRSGFELLEKKENLRLLIVGDGPLKKDLENMVLKSHLQERFIFTGMVNYEDIPFFVNISDIGVAPFILNRNKSTGVSPLKIFEYMGCGKPVVTTRIDGLEFIEREGIGRLVEPGDVGGLVSALDDLLQNKEKRTQMGEKALRIAIERFDWASKVDRIEKILEETTKAI
jgi:glycosyltransferase involved in cell wall biosynthesis